jgi:hypothetical protein
MEIDRAIRTLCRTPAIKDKICEYIQRAVRRLPDIYASWATNLPLKLGLYKSYD